MTENAHPESRPKTDEVVRSDDGIELSDTDLDSVAGGVTWHPNQIEDASKRWEDTPEL